MVFIAITTVLTALDLGLKWVIEQKSQEQFPRPMEKTGGRIWLYRNHNAGFPFGFLEQYAGVVRMVPLVIISALSGVFCYLLSKKGRVLQKTGLAILLGGALSNLYDRMVRHYVVDYFSLQFGWLKKVVLNLGDVCVFAGSGLLLVLELVKDMGNKPPKEQ